MKHFLLLLLFFPFVLSAQAELDIAFENEVQSLDMVIDEDIITHDNYGYLHNLGDETVNLRWSYELSGAPAEWFVTLCDDVGCYFGHSSSNFPASSALVINADESSLWKFSINPGGVAGSGTVVFNVYDDSDVSTVIYSEVFEVTVEGSVSTNDFEAQVADLSVYPNPVRSTLNISDDSIVDEVVVYNLLGKPVKRFYMESVNNLDMSDLMDGVYLVGMYNEEQGLLKTSRVLKKNSRP